MNVEPITEFKGSYFFLSNFYSGSFSYAAQTFKTVEHAFHYMKSAYGEPGVNDHLADAIVREDSPSRAKYHGRSMKINVAEWDRDKISIMSRILDAKFDDDYLSQKLADTWPRMLVEGNTWNDTFWGRCNGVGSNILGVLLMELRSHYI